MKNKVVKTKISGVYEIRSNYFIDMRGSFRNIFRAEDETFGEAWGNREIRQVNQSITKKVGVVRGLHYQLKPHSEAKLVRWLSGRIWDIAVDLRPWSKTYCKWHAVELSSSEGNALLIPEGCAHGFQVLEADSELIYLHSGQWVPKAEAGVRFDDPLLSIPWPITPTGLSGRDLSLPLLNSKI